ncbi:Antigen, partial [Armadillidium nasatum]
NEQGMGKMNFKNYLSFLHFYLFFFLWSLFPISLQIDPTALERVGGHRIYSNVRGPGYEYPRISFPDSSVKVSPRWLIIGGRHIVPGSVYRLAVEALRRGLPGEDLPLTVRASISHNNQQVSFGKIIVQPGELSNMLLKIPDMSIQGDWQLRVEGREGTSQIPVFKNTTKLTFSPRFLTILIQTSRPVYNAGQRVRFRGVMLTRELKPYEEPVDIYVLVRIVDLSFELPEYPLLGNWTIQFHARQQKQNKTILVEQYFRPRFEVFVKLPQTFLSSDEFLSGTVIANLTNWRDVHGNCSLKLQIGSNKDHPVPTMYETLYTELTGNFTGSYEFYLPMDVVAKRSSNLANVIVRVYAEIGDYFNHQIQKGFALARIVEEKASITFLGDQPIFFKPGMPIYVHVFVSYDDLHPMEAEKLEFSELTVTFKSSKTEIITVSGFDLMDQEGVAVCSVNIPNNTVTLEISASFVNNYGMSAAASLVGVLHHSPRNRHLQIETSTSDANPGEFIILHVRSNFFVPHVNFLVVSNGLIVYSGREAVNDVSFPTVTTFSLPASAEMSPVAKILAWVVDSNEEIIAHSVSIPVNPLGRHEVDVVWNNHKDHSGNSVELQMLGEIGGYFATSAIWDEIYRMDTGHDLDHARVLQQMLGFHDDIRNINYEILPHMRVASTRSREGEGSNIKLFATSNAGPDAPSTFNFTDVFLLTDAMTLLCVKKKNFHVFQEGVLLEEQRCDGTRDCADFSDEAGCPVNIDPWLQFRLYRISRISRFYDAETGDWAWLNLREGGGEIVECDIPETPQTWVFSVFAVGVYSGLGLREKLHYDATRPFLMRVDAPILARMWEQVALTAALFNYHDTTIGVLLTLEDSEDYQSIVVEEKGLVDSYNPRRLNGTFQHIVWLPPGTSIDVNVPIVFTRLGEIEITIKALTQIMSNTKTVVIEVIPEVYRALAYEFFDLHLDESPIIPYSLKRRYVFGTAEGHVSVTGDVVGPAFPEIPVDEDLFLGFGVMGAETTAYNFAVNVWTLHYLRLTNQLNEETTYKVLNAVNVFYAQLARYQTKSGGFTNWIGSELSVWLTAHSLRCLSVANFQDWENLIYIDPKLFQRGVRFILQYQTDQGSFQETDEYIHPLDPKVDPRNISLTAHIVIALADIMTYLEGDLQRVANLAHQRAVKYLEHVLSTLTDPYDLAVVTWALFKSNSIENDYAFNALDQMKRVAGNRIYWSRDEILFNEIIYEDSQRPYMQPKGDNEWDSHSVEATAYALLVYIRNDGIGIIQENIVRFLVEMRKTDGGLGSTIDSLAALEALVQYSYRARLREITDMKIVIEQSSDPNATIDAYVTNEPGLSEMQEFELDNIFGHLAIIGRGSGQAILQLDYSYGVDHEDEIDYPPVSAYEIDISAKFFGRNNSYVSITSCQKWINTAEGNTSGLTVVDIHLPSGYYIMQDELIRMVDSRQ